MGGGGGGRKGENFGTLRHGASAIARSDASQTPPPPLPRRVWLSMIAKNAVSHEDSRKRTVSRALGVISTRPCLIDIMRTLRYQRAMRSQTCDRRVMKRENRIKVFARTPRAFTLYGVRIAGRRLLFRTFVVFSLLSAIGTFSPRLLRQTVPRGRLSRR